MASKEITQLKKVIQKLDAKYRLKLEKKKEALKKAENEATQLKSGLYTIFSRNESEDLGVSELLALVEKSRALETGGKSSRSSKTSSQSDKEQLSKLRRTLRDAQQKLKRQEKELTETEGKLKEAQKNELDLERLKEMRKQLMETLETGRHSLKETDLKIEGLKKQKESVIADSAKKKESEEEERQLQEQLMELQNEQQLLYHEKVIESSRIIREFYALLDASWGKKHQRRDGPKLDNTLSGTAPPPPPPMLSSTGGKKDVYQPHKWARILASQGDFVSKTIRGVKANALKLIDFSNEPMHSEKYSALAEAFASNQTIISVDLCSNRLDKISLDEVSSLFAALSKVPTMQRLFLDDCGLDDARLEALCKQSALIEKLSNLHLAGNAITHEGLMTLAETLANSAPKKISSLSLAFNQVFVGDETGTSTALSPATQKLISSIEQANLYSLNLSHCGIGDHALDLIAKWLKSNTSLNSLNLSSNTFHADGAKALAAALINNQSLVQLDVSSNHFEVEGAKAFAKVFVKNNTLLELDLSDVHMGKAGAYAIGAALRENASIRQLSVWGNRFASQGALGFLTGLSANTSLEILDLRGNELGSNGSEIIANALAANTTLEKLDLSGNRIGYQGALALAKVLVNGEQTKAARKLDLEQKEASSSQLLNIADDDDDSSTLKASQCNLKHLNLSGNNIGNSGVQELAAALESNQSLVSLDLSLNYIGDEGATYLALSVPLHKSLQNLDLSFNHISSSGVRAIALYMFCSDDAGKQTESIDDGGASSSSSNIDPSTTLSDAELHCPLKYFSLEGNGIGADGAKHICKALQHNTTLSSFNLSQNSLRHEGAAAVTKLLDRNTTLTHVYLKKNGIKDNVTIEHIAGMLKRNTTLLCIDLSQNLIANAGAKALAESLKLNTSLREIDLSNNAFNIEGQDALSSAQQRNNSVQILS